MKLRYQLYYLEFKHPFGVSSNTRTKTPSVFVALEEAGVIGYGEACLPEYLGETVQDTSWFFEEAKSILELEQHTLSIAEWMERLEQTRVGANAAKAAIDMALHDLTGKVQNQPLRHFYGINDAGSRLTSFTIGIDKEEVMIKKIQEAAEFKLLKIKAGTANDRALIEAVRRCTDKPLFVDVNQGWTDKSQALEMAHFMKEQNVLLLEQPMPVAMLEEMAWLTERSPIPTFADESAKRLKDLPGLKGAFSGINIKLMKSGGILEATKMIDWCRRNAMQVMLGCMAESSCATSAMAQLVSLADYVDLDAPLLYKNDPFSGINYVQGAIVIPSGQGIGVTPKTDLFLPL